MCFSLAWLEQVAIAVVVICVIAALLRLLLGAILPRLAPYPLVATILGFIIQVLWIVFWGVICIFAIIFIFDLIACMLSYVNMPSLMPHR